jgi:hypothetical protein
MMQRRETELDALHQNANLEDGEKGGLFEKLNFLEVIQLFNHKHEK